MLALKVKGEEIEEGMWNVDGGNVGIRLGVK